MDKKTYFHNYYLKHKKEICFKTNEADKKFRKQFPDLARQRDRADYVRNIINQRKSARDYARKYLVGTTIEGESVVLRGNKRNYPEYNKCEVCKRESKRLAYHHWDHNNLLKGLWVCPYCHVLAEILDKDASRIVTYQAIKRRVDDEHSKIS